MIKFIKDIWEDLFEDIFKKAWNNLGNIRLIWKIPIMIIFSPFIILFCILILIFCGIVLLIAGFLYLLGKILEINRPKPIKMVIYWIIKLCKFIKWIFVR